MNQHFSSAFVEEIESHGASQPSLGSIVSWSVRDVFIERADVAQLLTKHHLASIDLPEITELRALKRSLDEMTADKILRRTINNEEIVVYVLCKPLTDKDGELVLQRELKVVYRKAPLPGVPDRLEFSSPTAEAVLKPLIEKYQRSYTSGDITRYILLDTLRLHGAITLRPEGGMYFVPRHARDLVTSLRGFMKELGEFTGASSSFLSAFNVIDDTETRVDMQRHADASIKQEITNLLYRLNDMQERGKTRSTTVAHYLEEIERVGKEASLYHDLILLDAETIEGQLEKLRVAFKELISGKVTGTSESAPSESQEETPYSQGLAWYEEAVS